MVSPDRREDRSGMEVLNGEVSKLLPTPLQLNMHKHNTMNFLISESMHTLVHMCKLFSINTS